MLTRQSVQVSINTAAMEKMPALTISQPTLAFDPTSPGRPSFQIITVTQPDSDAPVPVQLSTDAPNYFLLATDNHPNFVPSLTFTPAPLGTYVHIRYLTDNQGTHTGALTIRGTGEPKTISLVGQSSVMRLSARPFRSAAVPAPSSRSGLLSKLVKQGRSVLALLLTGCLVYVGYQHRCQLFPALCPSPVISQPVTSTVQAALTQNKTHYSREKDGDQEAEQNSERRTSNSLTHRNSPQSTEEQSKPRAEAVSSTVGREPARQDKNAEPVVDKVPQKQRTASSEEESELERELNQPTHNP